MNGQLAWQSVINHWSYQTLNYHQLHLLEMKAKACARCRESKVRCDSDVRAPRPCSRCHDAGFPCVVDLDRQRANKHLRIRDLETEVHRLRQITKEGDQSPGPPTAAATVASTAASTRTPGQRELCGMMWSPARAAESFRVFFARCHLYLGLPLSTDPEHTLETCPLLFWVICAVVSPPATVVQLQPGITEMVAQIMTRPSRSIEVVQALLILCMWPFPFDRTLDDPSFIYCGMATHIGFQIGLHRPGRQSEFSSRQEVIDVGEHARRLTWVACYVVSQMQYSRLGVPSSLQADYTLSQTVEWPGVPPGLASLYRISRLTSQFSDMIGAKAQNWSGLQDPAIRLDLVSHFGAELDLLRQTHFPALSEPVETAFLTSKLHLWSFIFHDDMPRSSELAELYHKAEGDASDLIERNTSRNLSRYPWHVARSVLYAGLVLVKIQSSPYPRQDGVIADRITLASQTLQTAVRTHYDHAERWTHNLKMLLSMRDWKQTAPIRSRMAASLLFDTIRVMKENMSEETLGLGSAERALNWTDMEGVTADQFLDFDPGDWPNMAGLL